MYVESEEPFVNPYTHVMEQRANDSALQETIEFAQQHPDHWWNREIVRDFPQKTQELLEYLESTDYPGEEIETVAGILHTGKLKDVVFDLPYVHRRTGGWSHDWPASGHLMGDAVAVCWRRLAMARMYILDPEMAEYFIDDQIVAFHGTGGISLPSILQAGIVSHDEQYDRGMTSFTGEHMKTKGRRRYVSFSEWDDTTATGYAKKGIVTPNSIRAKIAGLASSAKFEKVAREIETLQQNLDKILSGDVGDTEKQLLESPFGALVGLSARVFERREGDKIDSDTGDELGFFGWGVAIEHLPLILVPKDKIPVAQDLVDKFAKNPEQIKVASAATLERSLDFRWTIDWLLYKAGYEVQTVPSH